VNLDELAAKISDLLKLPASAKHIAENRSVEPLPIPAQEEPLLPSRPAHSRSLRDILHDLAEEDRKQI
jgi:hypothetical protein